MLNNSLKNIAITGGGGAIGQAFARKLSKFSSVETINVFSRSDENYSSEKIFNHSINFQIDYLLLKLHHS